MQRTECYIVSLKVTKMQVSLYIFKPTCSAPVLGPRLIPMFALSVHQYHYPPIIAFDSPNIFQKTSTYFEFTKREFERFLLFSIQYLSTATRGATAKKLRCTLQDLMAKVSAAMREPFKN